MNTVPKIDLANAQPANGIDPREWETRVDLAAAYRLVALYGMDDIGVPEYRVTRLHQGDRCQRL